jgi:hypothetical protein
VRWVLPLVWVLIHPALSRADVLPGAPTDCPGDLVGVSDEKGPRCDKPPPSNCPSGWEGAIGGTCTIDAACDERACREGKRCVSQRLCYEERPTIGHRGESSALRALDAPPTEWVAVDVCTDGTTCAAPRECRPGKVCVWPGEPPAPLSTWTPEPPSRPAGRVDPKGCGGCAIGCRAAGLAAAIAMVVAAFAAAAARRLR